MDKPAREERTFETRLQFIREIFSDVYPQDVILQSAIQFKLGMSLEQYNIDTRASIRVLETAQNVALLKKLNKIYKES